MTTLFVVAFVAPAGDLPEGWAKLSAPGEGFNVTLPSGHKRQIMNDKGPDDRPVKLTFFRATKDDVTYIVGISEFSKEYMSQPAKTLFDNARDGSIARSGGKLIRDKDIKLGKYEGREVVTEAGKGAGFVRARVFIANGRQYSAMVAGKKETDVESEDALRFLDSFRLVKIRAPK